MPGTMIPMPSPQAIIHTSRSMIVGGVSIENSLGADDGDSYPRLAKRKVRPPGSKNVKASEHVAVDALGTVAVEEPGKQDGMVASI